MDKKKITSKLKSAGSATLKGASAVLDAGTRMKIHNIDVKIEELQKERAELEATLINKP